MEKVEKEVVCIFLAHMCCVQMNWKSYIMSDNKQLYSCVLLTEMSWCDQPGLHL